MIKIAQFASSYAPGLAGHTLNDLYVELERDPFIRPFQTRQLIQQVYGATAQAPAETPLSSLTSKGLGGALGYTVAKHFGLTPVGKAVGAALGVSLGKQVWNHFNQEQDTSPRGWNVIG